MEEDKSTGRPGSRRMEVLQQSLAKKQAAFDQSLQAHIDDVRSANGQPLNDKRTGRQTLDRWERQNDSLRTKQEDIQKTQRAIEREQHKIDRVARTPIPEFLKPMLESGEISQWRKYPNRFFVKGVDKARIIWFEDKQEFGYSHIQGMPPEQRPLFKAVYDKIRAMHSRVRGSSPEPAVAVTEERNTVPGTGVSAGASAPSENPPAPPAGQPPREQSLQERLQLAQERYTEQTLTLPPPQQERRRLLESQMETLIKGLPEQTQMQARINFYTSQVEERLRQVQKPEPPGQSEISFDR